MRFVGILFVFLALPVFIAMLRAKPRQRKWAYFAIGILPFTMSALNLDASLIVWAWPGYSQGVIVSLLDALALALIIVNRGSFRRLPFLGVVSAYFLAVFLSLAFANEPTSAGFYAFQLLRMLLLFAAVASFAAQPVALRWLAFGLAAGVVFQVAPAISQRLGGLFQIGGTMGHQNLLGMMLHFVTLPLLAMLLAGERSKIIMLGVAAGVLAVALGSSRGSVGFASIGIAVLFALSMFRRSTGHKWKIFGLAMLALAMVAPLSWSSFERRFTQNPINLSEYDERAAFERTARLMWSDHPMGVGANQYVVIANTGGYSRAAGVIWNTGSRGANVHNLYLLAGAETGWLGLFSLVAMLVWPIWRGLQFAFRYRRDPRGDVVLGATAAILALSVHSFYEWVFVLSHAQYAFAISLGIIAGNIRQGEAEKVRQRYMRAQVRAQVLNA